MSIRFKFGNFHTFVFAYLHCAFLRAYIPSKTSFSGSRRNALLRWCQQAVAKFPHIEITNFSTSWADGQALCCLLAAFYPEKLNVDVNFYLFSDTLKIS